MPNRILRDYTASLAVNQLDYLGECLFVRLIQKADDFGRFYGNPTLIRSLLFPLKDGLRDSDISARLAACEKAGLIRVYESNGKPFIEIRKFGQRLKECTKSKFPEPPKNDGIASSSELFRELPGTSGNFRELPAIFGDGDEDGKKRVTFVTQKEKISFSDQLPQHLQTESFRRKWQEWENFRRKKRKPISQIAFSRQVKELEKWTEEQATEAVDFSIASDYQALVMPYSRQKNAHFKKDYSGI